MLSEIQKIINKHTDDICKDIKESSYIQKNISKNERYRDLTDIIIAYNDPNYSLLPMKDKSLYLKQKRVEIASEVEEKNIVDTLNFNKYLNLKKIQSGLTRLNCISSLFFLSEYYKCKIVIVYIGKNIYYETIKSYKNELIIEFTQDKWSLSDKNKCCKLCSLKDFDVLEKDIISYDVYDIPLKPLSSYKLTDLQNIANERGIDTKKNGKNKIKNVLYEELRIHFLNLI